MGRVPLPVYHNYYRGVPMSPLWTVNLDLIPLLRRQTEWLGLGGAVVGVRLAVGEMEMDLQTVLETPLETQMVLPPSTQLGRPMPVGRI